MRGSEIKGTLRHDAGAFGRCSFCDRYSDDPHCLDDLYMCQCGKWNGYSGSFKPPKKDSKWNDSHLQIAKIEICPYCLGSGARAQGVNNIQTKCKNCNGTGRL